MKKTNWFSCLMVAGMLLGSTTLAWSEEPQQAPDGSTRGRQTYGRSLENRSADSERGPAEVRDRTGQHAWRNGPARQDHRLGHGRRAPNFHHPRQFAPRHHYQAFQRPHFNSPRQWPHASRPYHRLQPRHDARHYPGAHRGRHGVRGGRI